MDKSEVLIREDFMKLPNGSPVVGYAYLRGYSEQPTKNGGTFLAGQLECNGTVQFKVWGGDTLNSMKEISVQDTICHIHAELNEYAGMKSLIIKDCISYTGDDLDIMDFLERKYDGEDMYNRMLKIIGNNFSIEAFKVFEIVMGPIKERFKIEFAAIAHHDACVSGLVAHTCKVVRVAQIIKFYPALIKGIDPDVLYVGCALHDIGKIIEYNNGSITEIGKLMSHLTLGLDLIKPYKQQIIALKGERYYNDLLSVIQQHHGEYGERPRTLAAYVISIIDGIEARLTDINEATAQATGGMVKIEGSKLQFHI